MSVLGQASFDYRGSTLSFPRSAPSIPFGAQLVRLLTVPSHNYTHNIVQHDWSFLEGNKRHTHTLKAGLHNFPFSFTLDGNLPSSITTATGDGAIQYRLRAAVVRSGLSFSNLSATKGFRLSRTFTPEALEFNQTLEIENTWPGKVMYSITVPYKAYAAGDSIPVILKFMPIAKGVRVLSVSSVIKEYSLVFTKGSSHADTRNVITTKHELHGGHAVLIEQDASRPPTHWAGVRESQWRDVATSSPANTGPRGSTEASTEEPVDPEAIVGDDEVCTSLTIPLPPWTTPSHTLKPVQVTHKIKWSCAISNPDGHVSELRCALPICILDNSLLDEARAAGAPTRNLMMGTTIDETAQMDLPSYSNHVYDRIAVAEHSGSSAFTARSVNATPHHSPSHTPPASRPGSRPGSPHGWSRSSFTEAAPDVPPRRQLTEHAESALLRGLGQLAAVGSSRGTSGSNSPGHMTPPESSSRQSRLSSRSNSRAASRAGSRASSPERGHRDGEEPHHRSSGLSHLLQFTKPLTALTSSAKSPILRNNSSSVSSSPVLAPSPITRNSVSFSTLPGSSTDRQSSVTFHPSALSGANRERGNSRASNPRFHVEPEEMSSDDNNPLSRVPSYTDGSDPFVVPLDPALPTYTDSEVMERARSGTDLVSMGMARERSSSSMSAPGAHSLPNASAPTAPTVPIVPPVVATNV